MNLQKVLPEVPPGSLHARLCKKQLGRALALSGGTAGSSMATTSTAGALPCSFGALLLPHHLK